VGGTAEICRPGIDGLIVPPRNPAALAAAVTQVLTDTASCETRVRSARARVESDLSFLARVRALENIYQELVPCGRR